MQFSRLAQPDGSLSVLPVAAVIAALVLAGCGGGQPSPFASAEGEGRPSKTSEQARSTNREPSRKGDAAGPPQNEGLVRTDPDGRKWIDDIPLDVWYDDPLQTYQSNAQAVVTNGGAAPAPAGSQPDPAPPADGQTAPGDATPGTTASAAGVATDWKELISAAVLDAEAKALRNQLTAALQTVATYNNSLTAIQWDGATLCALAGIAIEHSDPVSWKDKAPHVRDLAQQIGDAAQERGRAAFEATQLPYEQLISVLSGNVPAGLEPAEPHVPFPHSASRNGMMRRMQEAFDSLSKNITNADRLRSDKDQVVHEASLLAALTRVISLEGYDAADEPDYAREARALMTHAQDARAAAEAGSYDAFREAVDRMGTRCSNCHGKYRFE